MSAEQTSEMRAEREFRALSPRLIARTFGSLGGYKWCVFTGTVMVCICAWADMQIIHEASVVINDGAWRETGIMRALIPLIAACLLNRVFGWLQWLTTIYAANRAIARLRKTFFHRLLGLSKSFFDTHKSGWLTARGSSDIEVLHDFMAYALMMLGMLGTIIVTAWMRITQIAPVLLLPALPLIPMITAMTIYYKRRMTGLQRAARDQNSRIVANMAETVRGVRVVQAFARQERNLEDFNAISLMSRETEIRAARLDALLMPALDFIGVVNTVIVISFAAWLMEHPDFPLLRRPLSTGDLIAYVLYMNVIIWPARMLVELYGMAIRAMAAAERVFEIMDMTPAVADPPAPEPLRALRGDIAFENAGFRYDEQGDWILRGMNLRIRAGETVALVGATGAGKTTIASLIARFHDVQEGRLTIDGVDIRAFRQSDLHTRMGIVLQQGSLFSGTVMDNLRFRRPGMADEEVVRRARDLGTHDVIAALSDGYQTVVIEGGESLSPGQRQVIALTRALLADPSILILDEPTSALDIQTESVIQNAVRELIRNRTVIIIAHRLSTVRHAGRILAIRHGRIVEEGSHEELMALNGYYRSLVSLADDSGRLRETMSV